MSFITEALTDAQSTLEKVLSDKEFVNQIDSAIACFTETYKNGGKVLACGNGGSMCDSIHFTEELTGRYRKDRPNRGYSPRADGTRGGDDAHPA